MKSGKRKNSRPESFLLLAAVITAVFIAAAVKVPVFAESVIKSRGNLVLEDGKAAVYAEDIAYLQSELEALYKELPVR